jgi:hypothetical protein
MDPTLKLVLEILCGVAALVGLVIVYAAPAIVDKRGLAAKHKVDPRILEHLPPEQLDRYRRDGAILNVKLVGVGIAVPTLLAIVLILR